MDLSPIWLSLKVSIIAVSVVFVVGSFLAIFLHRFKFRGHTAVEAIIMMPLVLPPTVVGFSLLLLFGRNAPLGRLLGYFGIEIVFSWWAAAIASMVVALPLMYQGLKSSLESIDANLEQAARTLGAGEIRVLRTVTLPLAWPGLVSGVVMAFTRAIGEFGATLMVAGNIPGKTQTIPLAIYSYSSSGDTANAGYMVLTLIALAFSLVFAVSAWRKKLIRWF
ncbi:MAG: molybdate ABC transporter permease subunit [Actinomycetota bacterium]|nr:molybdate ABC transporter permease subunit [Actinomycetota bacterium]